MMTAADIQCGFANLRAALDLIPNTDVISLIYLVLVNPAAEHIHRVIRGYMRNQDDRIHLWKCSPSRSWAYVCLRGCYVEYAYLKSIRAMRIRILWSGTKNEHSEITSALIGKPIGVMTLIYRVHPRHIKTPAKYARYSKPVISWK